MSINIFLRAPTVLTPSSFRSISLSVKNVAMSTFGGGGGGDDSCNDGGGDDKDNDDEEFSYNKKK